MTKVTYNMYSCDISCMSREMMGTDGRDCATCQNPNKGDMDVILEFLNENRTKVQIVSSPTIKGEKKT